MTIQDLVKQWHELEQNIINLYGEATKVYREKYNDFDQNFYKIEAIRNTCFRLINAIMDKQ